LTVSGLQSSLSVTKAHLQKQLKQKDGDCNRLAIQIRVFNSSLACSSLAIQIRVINLAFSFSLAIEKRVINSAFLFSGHTDTGKSSPYFFWPYRFRERNYASYFVLQIFLKFCSTETGIYIIVPPPLVFFYHTVIVNKRRQIKPRATLLTDR